MRKLQKNRTTVGMATALIGIMISGCGMRPSAGHVLMKMAEGYAQEESVLCNVKLSVKMDDGLEEMDVFCDVDVEMTSIPEATHLTGSIETTIAGEGTDAEIEKYIVREGDAPVCYMDLDGGWTRQEEAGSYPAMGSLLFERLSDDSSSFEVMEDPTNVNGMACYRLMGTVGADVISDICDPDILEALRVGSVIDQVRFAKEGMQCTLDIYKESQLPARLSLDLTDAANAALTSDADGITISEYKADIVCVEYADVDEIEIPAEVIEETEEGDTRRAGVEDEDDQEDSVSTQARAVSMTAAEPQESLGEMWDSYTVQIGETVLTFPCHAADLTRAGWKQNTKYLPEAYEIEPGGREMVWYKDESGNAYCVDVINHTDQSASAEHCLVYGITVDADHLGEDGIPVVFPGGLRIGDPAAVLEEVYGEPDERREGSYVDCWLWYGEDEGVSGCFVDVDAASGTIDSISIVRGS